jgi:hypothetical protein
MIELIKKNGLAIGLLLGWFFIHLVLYVYANGSSYYKKEWYPFTERKLIEVYDESELMLYGVGPFVFFVIVKLIQSK